jgi:aspartate racemase
MRRLGLIGGMSWESTTEYYRLINRGIATRLGGLHSADLLLHSVDFAPVAALQQSGDWEGAGALLAEAACGLERAGAHAIVLCTNTMHHVSGHIETAVAIPLLHIVDTTGQALAEAGIRRAGLLGTRYTMELPFWRQRLRDRFGVDLAVPDEADRTVVHDVIYKELCLGRIEPRSRAAYAHIIDRLAGAGAEAVVLGCTEITLLVRREDTVLPVFDTTALHADAAVEFALANQRGSSEATETLPSGAHRP